MTTDFTAELKTAAVEFQAKAKDAFEQGSAKVSEFGEFAKGNVQAVVESGKVLAKGVKELTETSLSDSRSAFETLTTDVKGYAAAKSPADFFQLHSDVLRRQFDSVVALTSKNTEAVMKLTNAAIAPLASRVNVAVEAVKKAA